VPIIACASGIEVKRAASHYLRPGDSILEFGAMLSHISQHFLQTIGPTGHAVLVNIQHNGINSRSSGKSGRSNSEAKSGRLSNPTPFLGHDKGESSSPSMKEETRRQEHGNDEDDDAADSFKTREQQEDKSFADQVDYVELDQFDDWRKLLLSVKAVAAETVEKNAPELSSVAATATYAALSQRKQQHFDVVFVHVGAMIGNDLHLTALSMAMEFLKQSSASPPRVMVINSRCLSFLARRLCHGQQVLDGTIQLPAPCAMQRSSEPYIITTVGVQEYRSTIPFVVQSGDEVLEVGCHSGVTTSLLHCRAVAAALRQEPQPPFSENDTNGNSTSAAFTQLTILAGTKQQQQQQHKVVASPNGGGAGFCIGVDIGPRIIQSAKKQYPDIPFAVGDAWKTLKLLQLKQHALVASSSSSSPSSQSSSRLGFDAVYADIGGLSGADGLLESISLLEALGNGLEPRCIVIKSLCMKRLASQLKSFTRVWEKIRDDREEEEVVE
jgi:hypothetical protein